MALAIVCATTVIGADVALPTVNLGPLLILPAALFALALDVRLTVVACIALGFVGVAADAWPQPFAADPWRTASALVLGASFVLAAVVARFGTGAWRRSVALDTALGNAQRNAVAAFSGQLPCGHGWKLETIVIPGERATPCVASAYDGSRGLEVVVASTRSDDVAAPMVLAALRAALPADGIPDARGWLRVAHARIRTLLRHTGSGCSAWAARLADDGDVRFASAGFAPVAIVRPQGDYRVAGGGGRSLGIDEEPSILEGFTRFDSGDVLVVADDAFARLLRRDAMLLWSLLAGSAPARESAAAELGDAGGFVLVARRVRGRDETDLDYAARLLQRLSETRRC